MRMIGFLLIVGVGGASILVGLGVWQIQRLAWKEDLIATINRKIAADPVSLPAQLDPSRDAYLPVTATGVLGASYIRILVSKKGAGAGYRIVRPMLRDEGAILIDMGFVKTEDAAGLKFEEGPPLTIVGNLQWPEETDGFTPEPDLDNNIWFARDVDAMAKALDTDPVLVVRRDAPHMGGPLSPLPVDTSGIPNDHLQYAITWFSLATIWLAMTVYFLVRRAAARRS